MYEFRKVARILICKVKELKFRANPNIRYLWPTLITKAPFVHKNSKDVDTFFRSFPFVLTFAKCVAERILRNGKSEGFEQNWII